MTGTEQAPEGYEAIGAWTTEDAPALDAFDAIEMDQQWALGGECGPSVLVPKSRSWYYARNLGRNCIYPGMEVGEADEDGDGYFRWRPLRKAVEPAPEGYEAIGAWTTEDLPGTGAFDFIEVDQVWSTLLSETGRFALKAVGDAWWYTDRDLCTAYAGAKVGLNERGTGRIRWRPLRKVEAAPEAVEVEPVKGTWSISELPVSKGSECIEVKQRSGKAVKYAALLSDWKPVPGQQDDCGFEYKDHQLAGTMPSTWMLGWRYVEPVPEVPEGYTHGPLPEGEMGARIDIRDEREAAWTGDLWESCDSTWDVGEEATWRWVQKPGELEALRAIVGEVQLALQGTPKAGLKTAEGRLTAGLHEAARHDPGVLWAFDADLKFYVERDWAALHWAG